MFELPRSAEALEPTDDPIGSKEMHMSRAGTIALFAMTMMLEAGAASTAHAVDGVIEINETCASLAGCFSGDTAGYPITIDGSAGRSYRLTSDLVVPDEHTDGIVISTSSITIDLNGFEIARSGCQGAIVDCRPPAGANGNAITITSSFRIGIVVTNGTVTGMPTGVNLGRQSRVSDLQVRWNQFGIGVFEDSTVEGNTVHENGDFGIIALGASRVQRNVVTGTFNFHGMSLASETGYGDNVLNGNAMTVLGGVDMGGNVCNGNATCP